MKGAEPPLKIQLFHSDAEVIEEVLVGVGDAPVGGTHPDRLGIEVSQNAVTGFAGEESFLIFFACCDIDREAAQMSRNAIGHYGMTAAFEPKDSTVRCSHLEILHNHLTCFDTALN